MIEPVVSVVMSVFNGESFLSAAIESILDQSFREFEFIVINDGSTDGSGSILQSYQANDPRIRIYNQENRGLVASLNRGCALARGKYIARMDADDIAVKNRLLWQTEFMETNREVAVLGGAVKCIDATGKVLGIIQHPTEDHELRVALLQQNSLQHSSVILRKDVFLIVGGYRKAFTDAEDYDLWLRVSDTYRLANLNSVLVEYRIHPNQICKRNLKQQTLSALAAQACARIRRTGAPDPLGEIGEITPATLAALGVNEAQQRTALARTYLGWIRNMDAVGEPSAALALAIEMLSDCGDMDKHVVVDTRLALARLLWQEGKFVSSIFCAARALAQRPTLVIYPLKYLTRRLWAMNRSPRY